MLVFSKTDAYNVSHIYYMQIPCSTENVLAVLVNLALELFSCNHESPYA